MTKEQILEGNKLIDESFFGRNVMHLQNCPAHLLKYNSSWDWIMPVIDKIESMGFYFSIERNGVLVSTEYGKHGNDDNDMTGLWVVIHYVESDTKIQSVYTAVLQFIQWYKQATKIK